MQMKNVQDIYPLAPMQHLMLQYSITIADGRACQVQNSYRLEGVLDAERFKEAWQRLVNRQTILRTSFLWEGLEQPLQIVHQQVDLPWTEVDWSSTSSIEQQDMLHNLLKEDQKHLFQLMHAPLMRLIFIRLGENIHQLIWSFHHILLDGWSVPLILREVFTIYDALQSGTQPQLPVVRPYRDYIAWLQKQDNKEGEQFWKKTLAGLTKPTSLAEPWTSSEELADVDPLSEQRFEIIEAVTTALKQFARQQGVTMHTLVQAAWALLLSYHTNEVDVIFGMAVAGRPTSLDDMDTMAGLFINNIPLRAEIALDMSLANFLKVLSMQHLAQLNYQYTPLTRIHALSTMPERYPLFESLLVFQNYPYQDAFWKGGRVMRSSQPGPGIRTNYPLTLAATANERLSLRFIYDQRAFSETRIKQLRADLTHLLTNMATSIDQTISSVYVGSGQPFWQIRQDLLTQKEYVPPRTPVEEALVDIWSHLLEVEHVGIYDNFFALGGHSLIVLQLASRINETFHIEVLLRDIFDQPTIAAIALVIIKKQLEKQDELTMDQLLTELEQLSDEEATQQLTRGYFS